MSEKRIADNRRARHDYQLLERIEAGLVLTGTEVKSLRDGRVTLAQSYADIRDGEAWLHGVEISTYDHGNRSNHEPMRPRKLLLHRRQIESLNAQVREKGLTIVPTRLYFKDGRAKVELAVARGKETRDKRRDVVERDVKRQIDRELKTSPLAPLPWPACGRGGRSLASSPCSPWSRRGATAAPNLPPAQLTLQPADLPGAQLTSKGPVHEKNFVAAYQRSFTFSTPNGASGIRYVQSESLVAATVARAASALTQVSTAFASKVGRAAFAAEVAKSLKVKRTAVKLSAPRIPRWATTPSSCR